MKKVDGYISDLLYKNDCVILPEFGGFVTSYAPAHLHPSRHTLYPPSKDILFNIRLQKNDGLLVNYIAGQEQIPYQESALRIREFTTRCMTRLQQKEPVVFENIGTFTINREGNIEFTPSGETNFLEDAYGLTQLVSPPLSGKQKKPGKTPVKEEKYARKARSSKKVIPLLAFVSILIAVTALWGYYHSPLLKDIYTNYSGIIPLIRTTHQKMPVLADSSTIEKTTPEETVPSPAPLPATAEPIREPAPVSLPPESAAARISSINYFIIAGAFQDPDNATSLIGKLRSKGFDSGMAGRTKGGLYRVCYNVYSDKEQAFRNLEKIRKEVDPNAWMFVE